MRAAGVLSGVALCAAAASSAPPSISGPTFPETSCFDATVRGFMDTHDIPGGAVAVMRDGAMVYEQGYGTRDVPGVGTDAGRAVKPETPFRVASLSKPITALAVLLLAQSETYSLGLDDTVFGAGGHLGATRTPHPC